MDAHDLTDEEFAVLDFLVRADATMPIRMLRDLFPNLDVDNIIGTLRGNGYIEHIDPMETHEAN